MLPITLSGSTLTLAVADPSNLAGLNEVKFSPDATQGRADESESAREGDSEYYDPSTKAYQEVLQKLDGEKVKRATSISPSCSMRAKKPRS